MKVFEVRHISISIERKADDVYDYICNPMHLPEWASGLSGTIQNINGEWIAEAPMGSVKIRFAPRNPFGVADHDVTLTTGQTFHNPLRVLGNQEGCEVVFTLYRQPEMTDEKFQNDANWIRKDLEKLKSILERDLE